MDSRSVGPATPPAANIPTVTPIEMFWDRYRNVFYGALVALVVILTVNYAVRYFQQKAESDRWTTFGESTGFAAALRREGEFASMVRQNPQLLNFYMQQAHSNLLTQLPGDLKNADGSRLAEARKSLAGTEVEPLVMWLQAHRSLANREWEQAEQFLRELEQRYPKHFLTVRSDYAPQFRAPEPGQAKPDPNQSPRRAEKLVDPIKGESPVSLLRAQILSERQFRSEHPSFYTPPQPEAGAPVVEVKTTVGTFAISLFPSKAPQTTEAFLTKVREGHFNGLRVDELVRPGTTEFADKTQPTEFHLGLPESKDDDRSKWVKTNPSVVTVPYEDSGLSHFPFMVAAAQEAEGKSSGERIWINITDAAARYDGTRVVFGLITEGTEVVQRIGESPYLTEDENRAGRGKPRDLITIESMTVR